MNIRGGKLTAEQTECFNRLVCLNLAKNKVPEVFTENVKDACDKGNAACFYPGSSPMTLEQCQKIVAKCQEDPKALNF